MKTTTTETVKTEPDKQYTVYACRWFDGAYGNTYHSVRIIRHSDDAVLISSDMVYGYDSHYEQTALEIMLKNKWITVPDGEQAYSWPRLNNYPIIWIVSDGTKKAMRENVK